MSLPTIALEKVDFLPPDRVTDDASILTLKNLVLEPMLHWSGGRPSPSLFGQYELSDDGRDWRFVLRDGAVFHDGTPVRAEDARAFIEAILGARDMFGMPWSYARYLDGARIEAAGRSCVSRRPNLSRICQISFRNSTCHAPTPTARRFWAPARGGWRVLRRGKKQC